MRINLALQGGGAHGAFTWGVLDRLLEFDSLEFAWVSGTSAGAVNAVALASGLAESRARARQTLAQVWEAVHKAGVPEFLRYNPLLLGLSSMQQMTGASLAGVLSPYDFNPLGLDPFKKVLNETIDFEKIRHSAAVELIVAATELSSGRARLFRRKEMSVEAVLASACLPTLHRAVEVDGKAYWDGGFVANPDLVHLVEESPVEDTLIVQLNPVSVAGVPTRAGDIASAVNRITFNAPFLRDIEAIEAARAASQGLFADKRAKQFSRHRFHVIEAGRHTADLPADSKVKPDWKLFSLLHDAGRSEAARWWGEHGHSVGRRGTVDLKAKYLGNGMGP